MSGLSFIMLKDNNFSMKKIIGLIISTIGAVLISSKSLFENLKFGDRKYYIQIPDSNKEENKIEISTESNKLEES